MIPEEDSHLTPTVRRRITPVKRLTPAIAPQRVDPVALHNERLRAKERKLRKIKKRGIMVYFQYG